MVVASHNDMHHLSNYDNDKIVWLVKSLSLWVFLLKIYWLPNLRISLGIVHIVKTPVVTVA
jgi:hypothetical protein